MRLLMPYPPSRKSWMSQRSRWSRTASAWGAVREPLGADEERIVRQAVMSLPPIFREVVVLRYFEDKSLQEMADILAVPLGTVKSRLRLAQGRLNVLLANMFDKNEGRQK